MRTLIIGCGYVGMALGAELVERGHSVLGLRRHPAGGTELEAAGIQPLFADITDAASLDKLPRDFDWVVNCAASGGGTAEGYRRLYLEGTRHVLAWLAATSPQRYVYTSSTGVLGQDDGSWVDETAPTVPRTESGHILVATEQLLLDAARADGFPAIILRLAGIYGPDRGFYLREFLAGRARLEGTGERFVNMIHRDDVVGAILAALERGRAGEIYHVADDEPATVRSIYTWLSEKLNSPMPPSSAEDPSPARRQLATNKRVSSRRLRVDLGYTLKYPTFREGFAAELSRQERGPAEPG